MAQPQRITLDPDPPVQGKDVKICYSFPGSGITWTTLGVTFYPGGGSTEYPVTESNPCVTVKVPGTATSILVEDRDGPSPDKNAPVVPA